MTQLEKLRLLIPDEADDATLEYYLDEAKSEYFNLRYPYQNWETASVDEPVVEPAYESWVVSAAVELYAHRGGEGEVGHTENGVARSWDGARLSEGLRKRITPYLGVV